MKIGKNMRVVLDVLLSLMIVFEMFIQYTGNFLHEVVGFAFFATVIVHLAFSAAWMKSTASMAKKGKLSGRRIALAIMGCLLAVAMIVLGVSSVAISGILYDAGFAWPFGPYALWKALHTVSSYALCALVVVHLGMHWAFLASAFKVPYDPARRRAVSTGVHAVAAVGAVALGVAAAKQVMPQALALVPNSEENASEASDVASSAGEKSFKDPVSDQSASPSAGGKGKRGQSQSSASASSNSASVAPEDDRTQEESPSASESSSYKESAIDEPESESTVSGICTLCRKRCPLSDPKCDRPYREELL